MNYLLKITAVSLLASAMITPASGNDEDPSSNQKLLADSSLEALPLPRKTAARFQIEHIVEYEDSIRTPRTRIRGPVTVLLRSMNGWIALRKPDPRFGLQLVRSENSNVSLGISWLPKIDDESKRPETMVWGYAKYLASMNQGPLRYEILSPYPPTSRRRNKNFMGRIPRILDYRIENLDTGESIVMQEIFLNFGDHWLLFAIQSPEALFGGNVRYIQNLLSYSVQQE